MLHYPEELRELGHFFQRVPVLASDCGNFWFNIAAAASLKSALNHRISYCRCPFGVHSAHAVIGFHHLKALLFSSVWQRTHAQTSGIMPGQTITIDPVFPSKGVIL